MVMEPDMQHRMPWYDRYEASSGESQSFLLIHIPNHKQTGCGCGSSTNSVVTKLLPM